MQRWRIYLDRPITRRKRFHILTDPKGEIIWRSSRVSELLDHLDFYEVQEYELVPEAREEPAFLCVPIHTEGT